MAWAATESTTRDVLLVDFGGVFTTSVLSAFTEFGAAIGEDPNLPLTLLSGDPVSRELLSGHESGRIEAEEFERGFADRLRAHGARVDAEGLIARMQHGLRPDPGMRSLVDGVRAAGYPVALVSNAFGRDCYAGFDLDELADQVVISSEVGVRKPSRKIYAIACERLGVRPDRAVLVDDLRHNLKGAARLDIEGVLHTGAGETARQLADRFGITA